MYNILWCIALPRASIAPIRWSSWSAITKPEGCALPVIISTFRGMVLSFPSAPSM